MARQKKERTRSGPAQAASPATIFLRKAYAKGVAGIGIGVARRDAEITDFPIIIDALMRNPVCKNKISRPAFPKELKDFTMQDRLVKATDDKEYAWTAIVLEHYVAELIEFVSLRDRYEDAFGRAELDLCSEILDDIENRLGHSIWSITKRIQFLQCAYGISSQKEFLTDILADSKASVVVKLLSYYLSMRNEENVSSASFANSAAELLNSGPMRDYATYHLRSGEIALIEDPYSPIYYEQTQPIIDRFQAILAMTALIIAKNRKIDNPWMLRFINNFAVTGDRTLTQLHSVVNRTNHEAWRSNVALIDRYTEGKYEELADLPIENFELKARSLLHNSNSECADLLSPKHKLIQAVAESIIPSDSFVRARSQIDKIQLLMGNAPISNVISSFSHRRHDHIFVEQFEEREIYASLLCSFVNPRNFNVLKSIDGFQFLPEYIAHNATDSTSYVLNNIIHGNVEDAERLLSQLPIPDTRRLMYSGHVSMKRADYSAAVRFYGQARGGGNGYEMVINAYLCNAYLANGELKNAAVLACEVCLLDHNLYRLFPLLQIARSSIDDDHDDFNAELLIIIHLLTRYVDREWETELSDLFENFIMAEGVELPHQLLDRAGVNDKILYILRYVCVPRVLDGTTWFADMEDLEDERIFICRKLAEIYPDDYDIFYDEIRHLVRNSEIHKLLYQVEDSLIYVDEEGVSTAVTNTMNDTFVRFRRLLDSPTLDAQAEKISQLLLQILKDDQSGDIKFQAAASEREALMNSVLEVFVSRFASDPAYGLDTNLSTTIRHGAFEGRVREASSKNHLLCIKDLNSYKLPPIWKEQLPAPTELQLNQLTRILTRFTSKIEEIYADYLDNILRIRGAVDHKHGLFNFSIPRAERLEFMAQLEKCATFDTYVDAHLALCWRMLDKSLNDIRKKIDTDLRSSVNTAFATLIQSVDLNLEPNNATIVRNAAITARTAFQASVDEILSWFKRPRDTLRSPFKFDVAIGVSLKQIEKCYHKISIDLSGADEFKIEGRFLDGLVEIFFILLQNAIRHSGLENPNIKISVKVDSQNCFHVQTENDLNADFDYEATKQITAESVENYERDTALKMARKEGGSGLSKIWRILEYDLRRNHKALMNIDTPRFSVELIFNSEGMISC